MDQEEKQQMKRAFYIPFFLLYLMWMIKLVEALGVLSFGNYGIYPRELSGLFGIVLAPLIHGSFSHLINNSVPLIVLTASIIYFYRPVALKIIVLIWLVTGFCVWLGARSAFHIGASGVVYGEASFLFFSGVIRREIKLLTISLLVVFLYGGLIWGIFPIDMKMSWESHLFGGATGLTLAFLFAHKGVRKEEKVWDDEDDDGENPYWIEGVEDGEQEGPAQNDMKPKLF